MPILTPDELYTALGIAPGDLEQSDLEKYEFALSSAESAINDLIGDVEVATGISTARDFEYESGIVDMDPCVAVDSASWVSSDGQVTEIAATAYDPYPLNGPVYSWLQVCPYGGASPAMGFRSNADVRAREYAPCPPPRIRIVADWGFDSIPYSLKQAMIWTTMAMYENPRPYISESIEGYSRTIGPSIVSIPDRAMRLLWPYAKVQM